MGVQRLSVCLVPCGKVLGENPGKCLKYPPKDANEFATKVRIERRGEPVCGAEGGVWRACALAPVSDHPLEIPLHTLNPHRASNPRPAALGPTLLRFLGTLPPPQYIAGYYTYVEKKGGPKSPGKADAAAAAEGASADPMVVALENLYDRCATPLPFFCVNFIMRQSQNREKGRA